MKPKPDVAPGPPLRRKGKTMDEVSFDRTPEESRLIDQIVDRAAAISGGELDRLSTVMDLAATHANGCPMDFARLAEADDFNLAHDVFGIERHIDRATGKLGGCFRPRFARRTPAS